MNYSYRRISLTLIALATLCLAVSRPAFAQGTWTTMPSMPTARSDLAAATGPDGKIYAIGGYGPFPTNKVEVYDLNTWADAAPFPCGSGGVAAATLDGKIYALVVSGNGAGFCFQVYDTDTSSWTVLPGIDGLGIQALVAALGPDGRGRIYAVRGYVNNTQIAEYDPENRTWTTRAPMPSARLGAAAATGADGRIYVMGGAGFGDTLRKVEAYDPVTDTWTTEPDMPTSHNGPSVGSGGAAATGPDGRIYVIGGNAGSAVEVYDVTTKNWCSCTSMPTARNALAAATGPDGLIYALGGWNFGVPTFDTVEAYQPVATLNWITATSMPTARKELAAAATTGPDGRIYAIGGRDDASQLTTAEAYDSATDSWTAVAPLGTTRADLAAVALPDGRIFALGGNGSVNKTAEVYDPTADTWTPIASLPPPNPERFTADEGTGGAVGPDGRIYAIDCLMETFPPPAHPTSDCFAVAYDPSTDTWTDGAPLHWPGTFDSFAVAAGGDGRIYVVGGAFNGCFPPTCSPSIPQPSNRVFAYDTVSNTWSEVAFMPTPRWGLAATTGPDGKIYAVGGTTRDAPHLPTRVVDTVEVYDPTTDTWARVGCLPTLRTDLAAATGPDGRIYVIGGAATAGPLNTVEAFTP